MAEGKTTLLISYRLGITRLVKRILVFHEGRIAEDDGHETLMRKSGDYAKMYRAQARWYQENMGKEDTWQTQSKDSPMLPPCGADG